MAPVLHSLGRDYKLDLNLSGWLWIMISFVVMTFSSVKDGAGSRSVLLSWHFPVWRMVVKMWSVLLSWCFSVWRLVVEIWPVLLSWCFPVWRIVVDQAQFCCHDIFQCEGWWWITLSFAVMMFSSVKDSSGSGSVLLSWCFPVWRIAVDQGQFYCHDVFQCEG